MTHSSIDLSICIATFKRGALIGETLVAIADQLVDGVEVVVLDGASPDNTGDVVRGFARHHPAIRYVRADTNSGIDADFDLAVRHAVGKYCWLFSDDDGLAPNAIATVLAELRQSDPDLLVVDAEIRDKQLDARFETRRLKFADRREYGPHDNDAFMRDAGNALSFIGGTIIRRAAWMNRDRRSYYGSLFIHAGVTFQGPPLAKRVVLPESLIRIRIGNANWTSRSFEIWMFLWPRLIWSFGDYTNAARSIVTAREPYLLLGRLLVFRARGSFGPEEYEKFLRARALSFRRLPIWLLAHTPGSLVHFTTVLLLAVSGYGRGSMMYEITCNSRFANPASTALARRFGLHGAGA